MLDDYSPFKSRVIEKVSKIVAPDREPRRFKMARWMIARSIPTEGVEHFLEDGKVGNERAIEQMLLDQVVQYEDIRVLSDFIVHFELEVQIMAKLNY